MSLRLPLALFVLLAVAWPAVAAEYDQEKARVVVVRELILAGDIDGAERQLAAGHEEIEEVERLALGGLIDLQRGRHAEAIPKLERVLALRPTRKAVWLYLGQARFGTGDYEGALVALERGADVGRKLPGYFLLRARAAKELERPVEALGVLLEGQQAFSDREDLLREQALVLVDLGLVREALALARAYLSEARTDPYAWLVLAEALRDTGRLDDAAELLEEARLRFPHEGRVLARLAYVYAMKEQHGAAARLFESLLAQAPAYAFQAADQHRLAGRHRAALRCNALVEEDERRLRQRLAILLAAERFDGAAALRDELRAVGVDDDATRYQLAFAEFNAGLLKEARTQARALGGSAYAAEARQLLSAIQLCEQRPWFCP